MNARVTPDSYGVLTEPSTLKIQRLLPGPIERVWAYLTESELRRQWLAAGQMELKAGAPFELVWRNDELSQPQGSRGPDAAPHEQRLQSRITELDPPRRLVIAWGEGQAAFDLTPQGDEVLLTIIHQGLSRDDRLGISAGWHQHLNVLAVRMDGRIPTASFWDGWARLRTEYEARFGG